jgi:hypothetical protein
MTPEEREKQDRPFVEAASKAHPRALAVMLAAAVPAGKTLPGGDDVRQVVLEDLKKASAIYRKNDRIALWNRKVDRANELMGKKRRTQAEEQELRRLCSQLTPRRKKQGPS